MEEVHGGKRAVVLDLANHAYSRLVLTIDNPEDVVASLS